MCFICSIVYIATGGIGHIDLDLVCQEGEEPRGGLQLREGCEGGAGGHAGAALAGGEGRCL